MDKLFEQSTETQICADFIEATHLMGHMIHATATQKGWWPPEGRNQAECIALIHSELSEALEALREHVDQRDPNVAGFRAVEVELADAVIRILDFGCYFGYRVPEAIVAKHKYNEGREHRHGGKKF